MVRLARRPKIRRLQSALCAACELWAPPEHMSSIRFVHHQVRPTSRDVEVVAAHYAGSTRDEKRAVLAALQHATPHFAEAWPAVELALAEPDALLRLAAARAAAALCAERAPDEHGQRCLAPLLDDPIWTVRWHVAAALANTSLRPGAVLAMRKSRPSSQGRLEVWTALSQQLKELDGP